MHKRTLIFFTLCLSLISMLLPMPEWATWMRPAWVLMVLIYWAMSLPFILSVGTAWLIGLVVDLLNGTLLGEHALAYTIIIYFVGRMHIRLRMFPMIQQSLFVFALILLYQFIIYCTQGFIGELPRSHLYWLSSVSSMLLWPWLVILMRDVRRWFKVA